MDAEGGGRIRAETFDVETLVQFAWEGYVRVPSFQRDFKWEREDVRRLFDSILNGYPIGSLLLWRREAPAETLELGALEIPAPSRDEALWVVDGQQRILSLANALHAEAGMDARFALAYDLRKRTLVTRSARTAGDPAVVPLPVLFDLQKVIQWFATNGDIAHLLDAASRITRIIRQYQVPAYAVSHDDEEVLQDIFDRMNNYGKRLTKAEVFNALYQVTGPGGKQRLTVGLIADRIDTELGFGRIDDGTVLRAILARRGPDVEREIRLEFSPEERRGHVDMPLEGREEAFTEGQAALRRAVEFLQRDVGVPHISMVAYAYLLIVLCRFFAHHPEPSAWYRRLLCRWYWRAALIGPGGFRGGTTGAVRHLNAVIVPGELDTSVLKLLRSVPDRRDAVAYPSIDSFRANMADTKLLLSTWWGNGPRSLVTGEPFDHRDLAQTLTDRATATDAALEIFPRQAVPERHRGTAVNRILLPSTTDPLDSIDEQLQRVAARTRSDDTAALTLASHGIGEDGAATLRGISGDADIATFLDRRHAWLDRNLAVFLDQACGWGLEDRPSLSDLIDAENDLTEPDRDGAD